MSAEVSHLADRIMANAPTPDDLKVTLDGKGKLLLPAVRAHADTLGHYAWLSSVFNLDRAHPITGGVREGLRGAMGHVVLYRAAAAALRFEPASRINQPARLVEDLSWQTLPSDGAVHAFKAEHCRAIAHVVRMVTDTSQLLSDEDESRGIVGAFIGLAEVREGFTTYGTTQQRYEAAEALQQDVDPSSGRPLSQVRYLVDSNTGELIIRVGDLAAAARTHVGSSLPRGWLDARMATIGWERRQLQGYAGAGRTGRLLGHLRVDIYRGFLSPAEEADGTVNT